MTNTTTGSTVSHSVFARDFSAVTRRALLKRGVIILGITNVPAAGGEMPFANGTRGYELDLRGTFCIRSHAEVLALAAEVTLYRVEFTYERRGKVLRDSVEGTDLPKLLAKVAKKDGYSVAVKSEVVS